MSHVACHVSRVICHVSHVTCHIFLCFFLTNWWGLSVEGLLSTGLTPSSFMCIAMLWSAIAKVYWSGTQRAHISNKRIHSQSWDWLNCSWVDSPVLALFSDFFASAKGFFSFRISLARHSYFISMPIMPFSSCKSFFTIWTGKHWFCRPFKWNLLRCWLTMVIWRQFCSTVGTLLHPAPLSRGETEGEIFL